MRSERGSASQRLLGPVRSLLARQGKPPAAPGRHHELTLVDHRGHLVETVRDANRIGGHAFNTPTPAHRNTSRRK